MQQAVRVVPFILLLAVAVTAFVEGLGAPSADAFSNAFFYAIGASSVPVLVGLVCASIGYLFGEASGWPHSFKNVWERCMGVTAFLLIVGQVIPKL